MRRGHALKAQQAERRTVAVVCWGTSAHPPLAQTHGRTHLHERALPNAYTCAHRHGHGYSRKVRVARQVHGDGEELVVQRAGVDGEQGHEEDAVAAAKGHAAHVIQLGLQAQRRRQSHQSRHSRVCVRARVCVGVRALRARRRCLPPYAHTHPQLASTMRLLR